MRWLMLLQVLSAIVYYLTAPFALTLPIWCMLAINYAALIVLWQAYAPAGGNTHPNYFRPVRLIFTASLLLLEALISLTDAPISSTEIQGLANDAEVLITGILLGALWHDTLVKKALQ